MGEAKRKGTFEERKAKAILRDEKEHKKILALHKASTGVPLKRKSSSLLTLALGMAAASSHHVIAYKRKQPKEPE